MNLHNDNQGRDSEESRRASCHALGIDPDTDFQFLNWGDWWICLAAVFAIGVAIGVV